MWRLAAARYDGRGAYNCTRLEKFVLFLAYRDSLSIMEWFRRFADIPGVNYAGDPRVERSKLVGHDYVPSKSLWPSEGGGVTSASPAHSHAFGRAAENDGPISELLLNMMEGLELPGIPSDYHFIIQGCVKKLWAPRRRREEPLVFGIVEKLCWLDIRLIEAKPNSVRIEGGFKRRFVHIIAFPLLIDLYEREGFLGEALEVAVRASAFEQGDKHAKRLKERIAALESEDDGSGR
jgi:hypothetical protein